jgi:hypothetical protein
MTPHSSAMQPDRRRFLAGFLGTAGLVGAGTLSSGALLAGCSEDSTNRRSVATSSTALAAGVSGPPPDLATALAPPGAPGLIDEAVYQRRATEYLKFATEKLAPQNINSITAQLARAHREPGYTWDTTAVTLAELQDVWDHFDKWQDTRDFRLLYLHWMVALADGSTPSTTLAPDVLARTKRCLVGNRYRFDDPLPDGVVDNQVFTTENHRIIGLANEYLSGRRFPTDIFTITGLTGAQHADRSRRPILDWVDERARFGFFEWHSHVYMMENFGALITLAELADDPELVRAAGMALDLCLLDMAAHTHKGTYVASRGRTYKKDKMSARDEDTNNTNKFVFDDTELPYLSRADHGAIYMSAAKRYRPPQALIDMATASQPGVVRERHGIFVDGSSPVTDNPEAPFGYDFKDPANLAFWWSQGGQGLWQVTDAGLAAAEKFRLFDGAEMAPLKALVNINGGDPARVKAWLQANHNVVNFGQLREANTYGWRGDDVSLATVVDHRFGQMRDQIHVWIAAIDADALVFTTHPRSGPDQTTDWVSDGKPGYWTGEGSIPRSAQHERTGVHIYQPAWDQTVDPLLWAAFNYRDYTHAYFPQDHFDEVIQTGNWTVGRKGDGYIALWSWRKPTWREYDPTKLATNGMTKPFDLVAEGGPDNVWVVEVGEKSDGAFLPWKQRVTATEPAVERNERGFTVRWASPSSGDIGFGSTGDFTVKGQAQQIADFPRHASRFGTVDRLAKTYTVASDSARLQLDFDRRTRAVV